MSSQMNHSSSSPSVYGRSPRPNSIFIPSVIPLPPSPTKAEEVQPTNHVMEPSPTMGSAPSRVCTGTNTDNEEFANTTIADGVLNVWQVSESNVYYEYCGTYFAFNYPVHLALELVEKNKHRKYPKNIGVPAMVRDRIIASPRELVDRIQLYRLPYNNLPTMYVVDNCIYDIHVPLHLALFPRQDSAGMYYCGPADISADQSLRCQNCAAYGCYRGVFIGLCTACSSAAYDGEYAYTGYRDIGLSFYCIPPEERQEALPPHLLGTHLNDIGYTALEVEGCSTVILKSIPNYMIPGRYFRYENLTVQEEPQYQQDSEPEYEDNDNGYPYPGDQYDNGDSYPDDEEKSYISRSERTYSCDDDYPDPDPVLENYYENLDEIRRNDPSERW
jgi:hypothetical protein